MEKTVNLSPYELNQYTEIIKWESEEPNFVTQALDKVLSPVTNIVSKVIPPKSIEGALLCSYSLASKITDYKDIMRDAGVQEIQDLKHKNLEISDKLADNVRNWASSTAFVEGAATGVTGLTGLAVDVPTLITMAFRVIQKTALCYGYTNDKEEDFMKVIQIVSAASANTMKEKTTSIVMLRGLTTSLTKSWWVRVFGEETTFDIMAKMIKTLAKQLGINLTKKKVGQIAPIVGAGVSATMNAAYVNDIARVAKMAYQRQWLSDNGKIINEEEE